MKAFPGQQAEVMGDRRLSADVAHLSMRLAGSARESPAPPPPKDCRKWNRFRATALAKSSPASTRLVSFADSSPEMHTIAVRQYHRGKSGSVRLTTGAEQCVPHQ